VNHSGDFVTDKDFDDSAASAEDAFDRLDQWGKGSSDAASPRPAVPPASSQEPPAPDSRSASTPESEPAPGPEPAASEDPRSEGEEPPRRKHHDGGGLFLSAWHEPNEPEGLRDEYELAPSADSETQPPVYPAPRLSDESQSVMHPNTEIGYLDRGVASGAADSGSWLMGEGEDEDENDILENDELGPEHAQVCRLASALAKGVKATRLYPLDNPIVKKFARELLAAFDQTFSMMDEIRLTVGKTKFFFRSEEVLDQPGRDDSVPGRFFWDGIREITFRAGLTPEEITGFLGLCRRNHETASDGEDDLVTLFWEARFTNIAYIAVDDILDLENPDDPVPQEFGTAYMNFVDLDMHNLEDDEDSQQAMDDVAKEIQARMKEDEVNLFGVPVEARDALLAELAEEDSPRILGDILDIISDTLFLDQDEASFVDMVTVLTDAVDSLIEDGRIMVAAGLTRIHRDLLAEHPALTPVMKAALEKSFRISFDDKACQALTRHLNANLPDVLAAVDDFLAMLPAEATGALCGILADLESQRARRKVVEALTHRAGESVDVFLAHLDDPRPEMVRDIIRILGGTGSDKALNPLKKLARHADVSVRCTAIDALCRLGPAKSGDVLVAALHDRDQQVRLAAVKSLGEGGQVAVPPLYQIIGGRDFKTRDLHEKKSFFRAMGMAGGEAVVPLLEQFVSQKGLFRRGQTEEMVACACEGLGWAGGRRARSLLEGFSTDRSTMIRSAAQTALKRMDSGEDESQRKAA